MGRSLGRFGSLCSLVVGKVVRSVTENGSRKNLTECVWSGEREV